ncbi:MAG: hypothetical protein JW841_17650 [Deltaproteobacteria bacterium]|nr:hypothetical protein [Deltaproteobacteria bacterium]
MLIYLEKHRHTISKQLASLKQISNTNDEIIKREKEAQTTLQNSTFDIVEKEIPTMLILSLGKRHDWRDALKSITVPTLILQGDADLQTLDQTRAFASLFSHSRFMVVPGAGHFPFNERPIQFAQLLRNFLLETISTNN